MEKISIALLVLSVIAFSFAEDDGRYRPEVHSGAKYHTYDVGNYFDAIDGNYRSLAERNGKYNSIYNAYQPLYAKALNRELLAPYSFDQDPFPASSPAVTYRPAVIPAVSTYRSNAYSSTPKPVYRTQYIPGRSANIVRQDNDFDVDNYHYSYQTDNGITAEESGDVKPSENGGGTRTRGFYEYVGDDGVTYRVDYTADENGFRPVGAHLPQVG